MEKLRKDLNNDMMASEDRTQESIRTSANEIRINQKNLQKQTGTRNGIPNTGPSVFTPPQAGPSTQLGNLPPRAPPEVITVPRQVVDKNEDGTWAESWRDVAAKKRNPNPRFVFTNRKTERKNHNDKLRARRELMIYSIKTPLIPDKKGDIEHVMEVAEELRETYIGAKGFNI